MPKMAGVQDQAQMLKFFMEFSALFTDEVSCSEDPSNPLIGYEAKGSLADCLAVKATKLTKIGKWKVTGTECTQTFVDENQRSAAAWLKQNMLMGNGELVSFWMAA